MTDDTLLELLVLTGPALVVPAALATVPGGRDRVVVALKAIGRVLGPLVAVVLVLPLLGFGLDSPWLVVGAEGLLGGLLVALGAHLVYWRPPRLRLAPLALHVGLLLGGVAAAWSPVRLALFPELGLDADVAATARAHAYLGGTGLLTVCALASRRIGRIRELYRWRVWMRLATVATLAAAVLSSLTPLAPTWTGRIGSPLAGTGLVLLALCLFRLGRDPRLPPSSRLLLTTSALLAPVALLAIWASDAPRAPLLHGALSAVGIVTTALLGLRIAVRRSLVHDPSLEATPPPGAEPVRTDPEDGGLF